MMRKSQKKILNLKNDEYNFTTKMINFALGTNWNKFKN